MSAAEPSLEATVHKDWIERSSDLLNPILVKETRQSLKSRGFVSVFILMLIASWLISAIGVLYVYGPELPYAAAGRNFFTAFYTVLSIAVFIVVPQGAFRSIQSERDLQTFEMLNITTLSPRKIVWGKWWSAAIQTVVYYAAIAPFMVFTNLLRGISLPFIAFVLLWTFIVSVSLAMLAIAFSTFVKQKQAFGVLQFLLIGPLVMVLLSLLQAMAFFTTAELPFDQPWFWMTQLLVLSFLIPGFVLMRQIATANLSFEGSNRSTGIRWSCLILLLIAIGWLVLESTPSLLPSYLSVGSVPPAEALALWMGAMGIWLWLVGLFAATEDERLSRRVKKDAPRSAFLRLLLLPFYPGGGRGFLYFLMSLAILVTVSLTLVYLSPSTSDSQMKAQSMICAASCYLVFYIGLTAFLGRGIRRIGTDLHAAHARVLGILTVAAGIIGPFLFFIWDMRLFGQAPVLMVTNPPWVCWQLLYGPYDSPPFPLILMMGGIGLLLNVRSLIHGVREFLTLDPTALSTPERRTVAA